MFCMLHALTDTFTSPQSDLNDQELTDTFTSPQSDLNDQELPDTFKAPESQFKNQNHSNLHHKNIISSTILDSNDNYSFWMAIHCNNIDSLAGFQFELPSNLELLDVIGGRSENAGFQLHHNDNGLILGFSMSGEAIPQLPYGSNEDESIIVKLHVKADQRSTFYFHIKTILAGTKGEKLSFKNLKDELTLENQSIIISFFE